VIKISRRNKRVIFSPKRSGWLYLILNENEKKSLGLKADSSCSFCAQVKNSNSEEDFLIIKPTRRNILKFILEFIFDYNQHDATLHNVFIVVKCSTCFRRVLRPSPGAQNCVHSIGYLPDLTATSRCRGRAGTGLQEFHDSSQAWQVPDAVYTVSSS
jgi:hypothetical protein